MGRSVDYLSNASGVTYFDVSSMGMQYPWNEETEKYDEDGELEYDEFLGREDWANFVGEIQATLLKRYPSLEPVKDKWDGQETSIILENTFCEIGISQYCGLASLSIRVKDDLTAWYQDKDTTALAENWVDSVWPNMVKILGKEFKHYTQLYKQGAFSNGEGVYAVAA